MRVARQLTAKFVVTRSDARIQTEGVFGEDTERLQRKIKKLEKTHAKLVGQHEVQR